MNYKIYKFNKNKIKNIFITKFVNFIIRLTMSNSKMSIPPNISTSINKILKFTITFFSIGIKTSSFFRICNFRNSHSCITSLPYFSVNNKDPARVFHIYESIIVSKNFTVSSTIFHILSTVLC